jgi:multidrug efflux system outer membrane protein
MFFFEKKNQKTFTSSPSPTTRHGRPNAYLNRQKFFGSFFQKRTLLLVFLSSCTLAPPYKQPPLSVPASYPNASVAEPARSIAWQQFFTDPALKRLLSIALRENRDVRTAAFDVAQAKAQFRVQRAALFPALNVTGVAEYEGLSQSGLVGGTSAASTAIPTGATSGTFRYYTVSAGTTSYELDLFGQQRSLTRQAFEKYLAQGENQRAVALTVIGNVANAYITWLADQELLRVTQDTLRAQEDTVRLTQAEFDHGEATLLSLRQAQTSALSARASLAQYQRAVVQDANELALLIGAPVPADLPPPARFGAQTIMADLPAGLPADLLTRRPDIRKAEHTLRADNADIGSARAAFFPQIQLTGSGGLSSLQFGKLFTPGALTWSFAPQITVPIFTFGQTQGNLDAAKAQRDIDVAAYEKAVQTAFHDVANALVARATYVDQVQAQSRDVDAAADYDRLATMRFKAGIDNFLTALDAERTLYSAQQTLVQARAAQLQNLVALYQALGGGW